MRKMKDFHVRTDLALEAKESVENVESGLRGVRVEEYEKNNSEMIITKVYIDTKNGAKALGKPMGTYITLEACNLPEADEGYHQEISAEIAKQLQELLPESEELAILVVGLGNREVTADSLGPKVVDNLYMTRHIIKEYGKAAYGRDKMHMISGIVPGVMAQTGMETAEIIKGVVEQTKPDVMIVIDSLAARSTKRLNRTIQITDTGIHPGSGVGNHRNALTREVMGIPVIAIGIPTVVDAVTIAQDAVEKMLQMNPQIMKSEFLTCFHDSVKTELVNFYMTGKDVDEIVKRTSFTVSEALNMVFSGEGQEQNGD